MTTSESQYNAFAGMEMQEIEGLTKLANMSKPSIPMKIKYDDILVHKFYTSVRTDPRAEFNKILGHAEKTVDDTINAFAGKDSVKQIGLDSWQMKIGFLTLDICLHCFTEYDCSIDSFEDTAIQRVVITMVASFDTKCVYKSASHSNDAFDSLNKFYCDLQFAINI